MTVQLTERELQILVMFADGDRNADIADQLFLSTETIKTYARRIDEKLGARTRAHAVALAYHLGILVPKVRL